MAGQVLRQAAMLALAAVLLALFRDRLAVLDFAAARMALADLPGWRWAGAALATALSFAALGRYDALIHRHLGTGVPPRAGMIAGAAAIAVSQAMGLGILSGTLARWRLLPGLGLGRALAVTLWVGAGFMAALAVLAAGAALMTGAATGGARSAALALLGAGLLLPLALLAWPALARRLPSLPTLAELLACALVDTGAACVALWLLWPGAAGLAQLYPAFLLATAAGLVSALPGGVGATEIALTSLLPAAAAPDALAALLASRLLGCAAPALLALPLLIRPPRPTPRATPLAPQPIDPADLQGAPQSEVAVLAQSVGRVLTRPDGALGLITTPQTLVQFLDPLAGRPAALLGDLARAARAEGRVALAYRIGPRAAAAARAQGWTVRHIADEAILDPARFRLDTPARRTLRRKLRHAAGAGVTIRNADRDALPWAQMAAVDRSWQTLRGPARGVTMGRFCAATRAQRGYLAYQDGRLVAFATFHSGTRDCTLDLMRFGPEAPDGTMKALIVAALAAARAEGLTRLSLAAIPARAHPAASARARRLARWHLWAAGAAGLAQFKDGFAPAYEPRYAAAPSRLALALGLADLAASIRHPPPPGVLAADAPPAQDHPEDFAVAKPIAA